MNDIWLLALDEARQSQQVTGILQWGQLTHHRQACHAHSASLQGVQIIGKISLTQRRRDQVCIHSALSQARAHIDDMAACATNRALHDLQDAHGLSTRQSP